MKDTGTRNTIFTLRDQLKCKRIYICFIDYTKAFDRVNHKQLLDMLQNLDLEGKDIRFLRNLYWEQQAGMRINIRIGNFKKIKKVSVKDVYFHLTFSIF